MYSSRLIFEKKNKIARVQRLNKAQEASDMLVRLTDEKNTREAKESRERLDLYKRDVEAKESIAKSLALLVGHYT